VINCDSHFPTPQTHFAIFLSQNISASEIMEVTLRPHEALGPLLLAVLFPVFTVSAQQKTMTIATVNNPGYFGKRLPTHTLSDHRPDLTFVAL
jgi:hypothetical protein